MGDLFANPDNRIQGHNGEKVPPMGTFLHDTRERQHRDLGLKGGQDPLVGGGGRKPAMRSRMLRKLSANLPPSS